jgi:hypothetical protein
MVQNLAFFIPFLVCNPCIVLFSPRMHYLNEDERTTLIGAKVVRGCRIRSRSEFRIYTVWAYDPSASVSDKTGSFCRTRADGKIRLDSRWCAATLAEVQVLHRRAEPPSGIYFERNPKASHLPQAVVPAAEVAQANSAADACSPDRTRPG